MRQKGGELGGGSKVWTNIVKLSEKYLAARRADDLASASSALLRIEELVNKDNQ